MLEIYIAIAIVVVIVILLWHTWALLQLLNAQRQLNEGWAAMLKSKRDADAAEQTRDNRINEGIDNIMMFSVNGKTGFETMEH